MMVPKMTDMQPMKNHEAGYNRRVLEWVFSILGALNCILVSIVFLFTQITYPGGELIDIWPFPLFYFIEITIIGILCVVAVAMLKTNAKSFWSGILWICSGILVAFVILGAWTIGFYLIPAMLLFLLVGIFADKRTQGDIPLHIIFYVAGGIAQATFVFLTLLNF
jgi:hypothetical protein